MMKRRFAATTGLALAWILNTAASDPAPTNTDLDVVQEAWQVAFTNTVPAGERVYSVGDAIIDVPLVWEAGARLSAPLTIVADAERISLNTGDVLPAVLLGKAGSEQRLQAYCTPRKPGERKADSGALGMLLGGGSLWRSMLRAATDKQFCLIDADKDGVAEQSVLVHAGSPAARTPVAITPVPLDRQTNLPVSGVNAVRITLDSVAKSGKSASFYFDVVQQGKSRTFTSLGDTQRYTSVSMKKVDERHIVDMANTRFEVVSVDGSARQATLRWPEDRNVATSLPIPDALRIIVRYGYY